MFEEIISSIASDIIKSAEVKAANSIVTAMGTNRAIMRFNLPNIKKPDLVLQGEDIVVRAEGLYSWFIFYVDYNDVSTAYIDVVNYPKTYSDATGWPVNAAQQIHVKYFENGRLYNPHDPLVRIRWEVFGNNTKHKLLETDTTINNSTIIDPLSVYIDHASTDYMKYSKFIVKCRVYRPFGNTVTNIFKQTISVKIIDKLDRSKPYVHWHYMAEYIGAITDADNPDSAYIDIERNSKIHYTDYYKRCLFADKYSNQLLKGNGQLSYLNQLPFDIADIENHRDEVCPYCFFGGPDKHVLK
jgi:hypothetical protein